MARIARVVLPGYPHHVTQRGNDQKKGISLSPIYLMGHGGYRGHRH